MTTNTFKFTELSISSKATAIKEVNVQLFLEHEGNRFHSISLNLFVDFKKQLSDIGIKYKKLTLCSTDVYAMHFSEIENNHYLLEFIIKNNASSETYTKYLKTKELVKKIKSDKFSFNMDNLWGDCPFQLLNPRVYILFFEYDYKFVLAMKYIVEVNSDDEVVSEYKFPALLDSPLDRSITKEFNEFVSKINKDLLNTIKQVEEEINSSINKKLDVIKNKYLKDYANSLKEDVQYSYCKQLLSNENSEQYKKYTFSKDGNTVFNC